MKGFRAECQDLFDRIYSMIRRITPESDPDEFERRCRLWGLDPDEVIEFRWSQCSGWRPLLKEEEEEELLQELPQEPLQTKDLSDYILLLSRLKQQLDKASEKRKKEIKEAIKFLIMHKDLYDEPQREPTFSIDAFIERFGFESEKFGYTPTLDPEVE